MNTIIENGVHYLSGIGSTVVHDGWNNQDIDVDLFCIDDTIYGAYLDEDDGLRSYGRITSAPEIAGCKCQYTFEPQKVIVENLEIKTTNEIGDPVKYSVLVIKDAILNKEVLRVGTDFTDTLYPLAIFDYQPMNLYVNVARSMGR